MFKGIARMVQLDWSLSSCCLMFGWYPHAALWVCAIDGGSFPRLWVILLGFACYLPSRLLLQANHFPGKSPF
jgi:hypothetical protein